MSKNVAYLLAVAAVLFSPNAVACGLFVHAEKPWSLQWSEDGSFTHFLADDVMGRCEETGPMMLRGDVPLWCTDHDGDGYESWYKLFPGPDGLYYDTMLWGADVYYRRCD